MVVGRRGQQLLKSGKTVSFTNRFPFGPSNNTFGYKNYSSFCLNTVPTEREILVRLCDCRSLHFTKETTRSVLTKLSPQECPLTTLSLGHPGALSREISVGQSPQLPLTKEIDTEIKNTNIPVGIFKLIFKNPEETFAALAELLSSKSNPDVSKVLDVFNYNFGAELLVVNGEYLQVDPAAYQRILSDQARDVVRSVYPRNFLQQLVLYGMLETHLQRSVPQISLAIEHRKVPLEKMTALIASDGHQIAKRDVISDLVSSVGTTLCNEVVSVAYTELNNTLALIIDYLDAITINGSDDNILATLVANLTSLGVEVAKEVISGVNEIAEALTSSICSDLFSSSRKRRDLSTFDLNTRNTSLAEPLTRDVALINILNGLFDIVWGLLSGVINTTLTTLVDSIISVLESYVSSFLESTIGAWAYSLINSLFPN